MLKHVTNELRSIAIDYGIPIVTAHQFNRAGLAIVNNAIREGKSDIGKFLGGENVGSAYEVMENADMTIGLNLERKRDTDQLYLTFYRMKARYRISSQLSYFNQPFKIGSSFQLIDDITKERAAGIISLDDNMQGVNADKLFESTSRGRFNHTRSTDSIVPTVELQEEDRTFNLVPLGSEEECDNDSATNLNLNDFYYRKETD
jgi:hypothetical protein